MSWQSDGVEHLTYAARDAAYTARVWKGLRRDAGDDGLVQRLYEIHLQLSRIAAEMHTTGIYVHRGWLGFIRQCSEQEMVEAGEAFIKEAGIDRDPSDDVMRALLYKRHAKDGIRCFELPDPYDKRMYTDDALETISVDANSMLLLAATTELPEEVIRLVARWSTYKKKQKRFSAVRERNDKGELTKLSMAIGPDGRLRPGWNSCGTDTMRFSCASPNVQNIEQLLRHYLAPAPGHVIVHADKSQLELRVMAVVAADNVLQDALNTGDVYSFNACNWYNRDPATFDKENNKKDKAARKSAKIIHLGRQYGAGKQTVFMQALRQDPKFTFTMVNTLMAAFDKSYYRTLAYWQEEMARVRELGYSEGRIIGGRRYYPRPPELSEAVNFPVQRSAAEMMNLELIALHSRLKAEVPSAKVLIQLHDAFDVECREDDEQKVLDIMTSVMHREYTFCGVTRMFPVEFKVARHSRGETWFEC